MLLLLPWKNGNDGIIDGGVGSQERGDVVGDGLLELTGTHARECAAGACRPG